MLSQIIKEFRKSGGTINLAELSHRLDVEPSALDGMLEVLVRQGRLQKTCAAGGGGCSGSCRGCGYYRPEANMGSFYELAALDLPEKKVK